MTYPRPSARTSSVVLLALLIASAFAAPAVFANGPGSQPPETVADPNNVCTPGYLPIKWTDDLHPPDKIKVLRSKGPHAGHVETVNFWDYVAVVMRAEYSTGADKPPLWMQVGAITVKEYGWYKAMFWSAGRVTTTDQTTGATITECYNVKDTTADQIYKPDQTAFGAQYTGNIPTGPIYRAMAQTWQMSMRKWDAAKGASKLFLTGYRSGKNVACGQDTTAYKIFQKSFYDCVNKKLTLEEALRKYFEPVLLVNTRSQDSASDSAAWWGDLPVLSASGGSTAWSLYSGKADGFAAPTTGTFSVPFNTVVGYGSGNVDLPDQNNATANDSSVLSDVVMVTNGSVLAARATGSGFAAPVETTINTGIMGGAPIRAVFGDFDGDLLMDVGLLRSGNDGTSSLWVMKSQGNDHFADPVQVWTGTPDVTPPSVFVAAGDVNGDGKADLVVRDASGNFQTAVSPPSCAPIGAPATQCPSGSVGAFALGSLSLALADPGGLANAAFTMGDYDRDGRDDVIALIGGSTTTVWGMRAKTDNTGFTDKSQLWSSNAHDYSGGQPVAMNIDPDGMADLAVVQSGSVQWLRTIEKSATPAKMVLSSDFPHFGQDTTPPTVPTGFTATAGSGMLITLDWNDSTDETGGDVRYRIYRDGGQLVNNVVGSTYSDHPAKAINHTYYVKAIDAAGNVSAGSVKVTIKPHS